LTPFLQPAKLSSPRIPKPKTGAAFSISQEDLPVSLMSCPAALRRMFVFFILTAIFATSAFASGPYVIGSSNTVTADPLIPRPTTTPCTVTLFSNFGFDNNYNLNPFSYTPPSDCPGPWAKVVLEVDIYVTAGIQYDRTANIWLAGTPIFFGTTAEPSPALSPSWHTESDLTDYSSLFTAAQQGSVYLGNTVDSTYTGIQYATATLQLYPLASKQTAPVSANIVLPLSAGSTGGTVALNTTTDTLSGTFTFPTNIENAYLDIYSQSQSNDEFWYTCVPTDVSSELESCPNTGFRETEITIDGTPAGAAPVSPWIYTGGIDPWLWFPIPGVQTLNFAPYRVDLTPFAALLSNGQQHTVAISVYNADSNFSDTAALLLYLDAGSTTVTGATVKNSLTAPNPVVTENLNVGTSITGSVQVASNRGFVISGFVNTSHGKVTTTVTESLAFRNYQVFNISSTQYLQNIQVSGKIHSATLVQVPGQSNLTIYKNWGFPLVLDINEFVLSNGGINQTTKSRQTYSNQQVSEQNSILFDALATTNTAVRQDTLEFDSSGNLIGNIDQSASQTYNQQDAPGVNYFCVISAAANALTSFSAGCSQ
jgi:Peptide N-acetyl-beta-D-glucosaminyl asparaginase amidase A